MLNETFVFKGKRANSMGIELQDSIIITPASPRFTEYVIPGRNGTLYEPDGTYEDRSIIASCFLLSHLLDRDIDAINAWLISEPGYHRFEDPQDPNHFMMALAKSGIEKHARGGILNAFPLEFVAKPQRYLKIGEKKISISADGATIKNPTKYPALPLFEFCGEGDFDISIAGKTLSIKDQTGEPFFYDAELDAAYRGDENLDGKVGASDQITLPSGQSGQIEIDIDVSKGQLKYCKITPRWWEI